MFLKDKYGKKWKLQAAKVLRTGALCVALAGVGTGVMGTLGELGNTQGNFIFTEPYDYIVNQVSDFHFTNTYSPITNITLNSCGDKVYNPRKSGHCHP